MSESRTILIVEDNSKHLKLFRDILTLRGHEILEAGDGEEGLAMARLHRPDVILVDIQIPHLNGLELARILKEKSDTRSIPLVAVTARAMKGDQEYFLEQGFTGYISKPVDPRAFAEQVESYFPKILNHK